MSEEQEKRKTAAILRAGVREYSRLVRRDRTETMGTMKAYIEEISALVRKYRGRIVDASGGRILAEFSAAIEAVNCATMIQEELIPRYVEMPDERRMEFRIGISLGDVVEEDDRIYGDGVDIAARLENLSDGGGICISGSVYEQVKDKTESECEYLGKRRVKNITEPISVYRVLGAPGSTVYRSAKVKAALNRTRRRITFLKAGFLILIISGVVVGHCLHRPSSPPLRQPSDGRMDSQSLAEFSIVVLPFVNVSDDSKRKSFSTKMTNQIIAALSKVPRLSVVVPKSTFRETDEGMKARQVGRELGARYVLEGSVNRSGDRLRIAAQLLDTTSGEHLWAERYDRNQGDIYAIRDAITASIVRAMRENLTKPEQTQKNDR